MQSKSCNEQIPHSVPPLIWFETVAVVLIVIGVALTLAARQEQHKPAKAVHSSCGEATLRIKTAGKGQISWEIIASSTDSTVCTRSLFIR